MDVSNVGLESLKPFWYGLVEIGVSLFIESVLFELDSVEAIPEINEIEGIMSAVDDVEGGTAKDLKLEPTTLLEPMEDATGRK